MIVIWLKGFNFKGFKGFNPRDVLPQESCPRHTQPFEPFYLGPSEHKECTVDKLLQGMLECNGAFKG